MLATAVIQAVDAISEVTPDLDQTGCCHASTILKKKLVTETVLEQPMLCNTYLTVIADAVTQGQHGAEMVIPMESTLTHLRPRDQLKKQPKLWMCQSIQKTTLVSLLLKESKLLPASNNAGIPKAALTLSMIMI